VWGVVPRTPEELAIQPHLVRHWACRVHLFLSNDLGLDDDARAALDEAGVELHPGPPAALHHEEGKLEAVTDAAGTRHEVGTLLWVPKPKPTALADQLAAELGLERDAEGFIETDDMFRTNVPRVWAVGDVKGWTGGLKAAAAGYVAAVAMLKAVPER
jgi:pyruvate/2-oxoglutarate dehydrogenase complex dihydrolipoamide dehydrogenase (E3) component